MTSAEEKIEEIKSRFASGKLLATCWNSLLHAREFIVLKKTSMSITWKRLS